MCTVTWLRTRHGYRVFFNRDELADRKPAGVPQFLTASGVRWLASIDGEAGGTWLAVNELGFTVGIINRYLPDDEEPRDPLSRGLLVTGLVDAPSVAVALARLRSTDLSRYRGFRILLMDEQGATVLVTWDQRALEVSEPDEVVPITSSGFDDKAAGAARSDLFTGMVPGGTTDPSIYREYHRSHEPEGPLAVCMHGEPASTVSFSEVLVERGRVEYRYRPGFPCEKGARLVVLIERPREAG